MLAFCGRRIAVETLLARLTSLHPDNVRFWRAIAALAADDGDAAAARADLADLARTTRIPGLAEMCTRHAGADGVPVPRMSPQAIALVDDTETRVMREAAVPKRALLKSPVTLALIAVNVAAFAAEIWLGGSQSPEALVTLGALWPPLVLVSGEWWRLLTAPFLHFGPVHLVANMFVLALLGPLCETAFGRWPMLLAYLGGGVLSTAAVLGMMIENWAGYGLLVGASGAIFTLFGLLFVRRARQWLTSRDVLDRQQILLLLIVLAVQFAIDLTLPEVSLAAHASGFVVGALAGWLLWPRTRDRLDEGAGRPPQSA
jgi:rhomboid protease GluP